ACACTRTPTRDPGPSAASSARVATMPSSAGPKAGRSSADARADGRISMAMSTPTSSHQFLHAGHRYRVIRGFRDFDGDEHPPGERWIFHGSSFLPYDDGLSLFVSIDD